MSREYLGEIAGQANGKDEGTTKPSNPKDAIGSRKLDMGLVPWTLLICAARAFLEGALKYGRFNWRIAGVRASIYHAALLRHVAKWWNGQNYDRATRVHHLDNAIACLAIIRDAELYGKLTDDRPPCPNPDAMAELIDGCEGGIAHLQGMFKSHTPRQYTIADTAIIAANKTLDAQRTAPSLEVYQRAAQVNRAIDEACELPYRLGGTPPELTLAEGPERGGFQLPPHDPRSFGGDRGG